MQERENHAVTQCALKNIICCEGPRGLGRLHRATLRQDGSTATLNFYDPYLTLALMSGKHVNLTGYSRSKYTNLHVCFTALVRIC